jgi:hypothetical protein
MRVYIGFDDTDTLGADRGTGKLARYFERELPAGSRLWGVVRQQLLVHPEVPFTSHNSSACAVVDLEDGCSVRQLIEKAIVHIERLALEGSDPGLCVARADDPAVPQLIEFGRKCTHQVVNQREARAAARGVHLSGHGGTHDGIIGSAAAVGLTAYGWCGRFIEFGRLRNYSTSASVSELERTGIRVVSLDRDAAIPSPEDTVHNRGWLRPRLWSGRAVLGVTPQGDGRWETTDRKKRKGQGEPGNKRLDAHHTR